VVVAAGSFLCAQAPKLNALAAMATIITALKIFTLYFASFPSKLLPSFRQLRPLTQRFSRLFSEAANPLFTL
jgi:hypothetical protein